MICAASRQPPVSGRKLTCYLASSAALALAAALPDAASAQTNLLRNTMNLGQIVITASGFEQAVADAPASISVITREDLENGAYANLTDALREVQGVAITGPANEQDIQIRGLPGSYTLILVDGRRQGTRESRPNGSSGYEQSFLPPLNMIERIEVVRGPMSSLYGSDAMGGVINVITRPVADRWSGSVTVEGTVQEHERSGSSSQLSFEVGGPVIQDRLGLQVWGRSFDRREDRQLGGIQGRDEVNYGARLTFTPTTDHDIRLEVGTTEVTSDSTGGRILAPTAADSESNHTRDYWSLSHTGRWGVATTELSFQRETGERFNRSRAVGAEDWVDNARVPRIRNTVIDGQLTLPWQFGGSHTLVAGFQYSEGQLTDRGHLPVDQTMTVEQWALFTENEWRISDRFSLTGGLRYDRHEVYGGHFSPRLYAVWHATDELTIKGGVSTGFRAPDIRQVAPGYYLATQQGAGWIAPNPDLQPETSTNIEIGAVWERPGFSFSATVYRTEFNDKLSNMNSHRLVNADTGDIIDPLGGAACNSAALAPYPGYRCLWQSFNIDDAVISGVELAATWDVRDDVRLRGSYAYTDSEQRTGDYAGFPLQRTPRHRATLHVDWTTPLAGLNIWGAGTYHGREINAGARLGSNGREVVINGQTGREYASYSMFDLGANYEINPNVTINAAVYNVFDRSVVAEEQNAVGEGRRFWLGATTRF